MEELSIIINRQILSISTQKDIPFTEFNFENTFNTPEKFDFNDVYFSYWSCKHDMYLVTHDGDFEDIPDLKVITCNQNLLSKV